MFLCLCSPDIYEVHLDVPKSVDNSSVKIFVTLNVSETSLISQTSKILSHGYFQRRLCENARKKPIFRSEAREIHRKETLDDRGNTGNEHRSLEYVDAYSTKRCSPASLVTGVLGIPISPFSGGYRRNEEGHGRNRGVATRQWTRKTIRG